MYFALFRVKKKRKQISPPSYVDLLCYAGQSSVAMEMIFTARPITAKIVCGVIGFTCLFVGFAHFLRL